MKATLLSRFVFLTFLTVLPLDAVSVPICPTNKIAPHRRHIASWDNRGRTIGAFYDLLAPNGPNFQYQNGLNDAPSDLEETPDEDPDDCGDIEDYDETDLSSVTPDAQRRQGMDKFFGWHNSNGNTDRPQRPDNRPPNRPERPPYRPERPPYRPERPPYRPERPPYRPDRPPQRPDRPPFQNYPTSKPPYWSGGFFGMNAFRPPFFQNPSDNIKPIYENSEFSQQPYQPSVVGGPSGHIIPVSPARPNINNYETTTRTPFYPTRNPRFDPDRTNTPYPATTTRIPYTTSSNIHPTRERPRNLNNNSILGSFVDLLFK